MRHTFTAMTYNLWGGWDLESRSLALTTLMELRSPDVLGIQELHPDSRDLIDSALPHHQRVSDPAPGWSKHSNIWWDARVFEYVKHGFVDVGILSDSAGLFWAQLRSTLLHEAPLLTFATAHLTWPGHPHEVETDRNPRPTQARNIATVLDELGQNNPIIFTADMNDYARPMWAMYDQDFREPFGALGRTCPPTFPVTPRFDRAARWEGVQTVEKALDWIFFRGPLQPRNAEVIEYFHQGVAPSDHKPVMATFQLDHPTAH